MLALVEGVVADIGLTIFSGKIALLVYKASLSLKFSPIYTPAWILRYFLESFVWVFTSHNMQRVVSA